MLVTAVVAGDEMTFLLGSREIAGTTDIDVFSPTSPMGNAINGRYVGDEVTYLAPNGNRITVQIRSAKPYEG
jgi:transcription elongation factor GreA